jgi:formate hydrogenlyase subunit 6/NADH:ubiquinone oxidoreductase subunit I
MLLVDVVKSWLSRAVTTKYPKEKDEPKNYRGKIEWDDKKCIRCLTCVRVCPSYAIKFDKKAPQDKGKIKIDFGKCIFCYMCVEKCPVNALIGTTEFEMATHDKREIGSA